MSVRSRGRSTTPRAGAGQPRNEGSWTGSGLAGAGLGLVGAAAGAGVGVVGPQAGEVHVLLPGDVDDPTRPSGGNSYDRRICRELAAAGLAVRPVAVPGSWPYPRDGDRDRLAGILAALPTAAVVLLDGLVACSVPQVLEAQSDRLRLVVLVHLPLADETGLAPAQAAALDAAENRALQAATAVVATSTAVGRTLVTRHGLPQERVRVAPPGVDPADPVPASPDGGRLLSVASVTPRKGHDVLVQALAELADRPWTCVCAGPLDRDRQYVAGLRQRLAAQGLQERVQLIGPRTGAEVAALYAGADLLVLPSRAEPYGMVVTEALARGIPVLASAVDGVPEALGRAPGGDLPGLLVPPGDPAALAQALRRWFGDPSVRAGWRAAALDRRGDLRGWSQTAAVLADVLGEVRGLNGVRGLGEVRGVDGVRGTVEVR